MVAEENPLVCGHEIAAVVVTFAGSGARVVECENFSGNKRGIKPVCHQITADGSNNEPRCIEWLAAMQGDGTERPGT